MSYAWSVLRLKRPSFYLTFEKQLNTSGIKTTNWNCLKHQTHKCRATAITDEDNFIENRGEHNHYNSTGKPGARLVLKKKNIRNLSDYTTPIVAAATALQPITDDIATKLALPT